MKIRKLTLTDEEDERIAVLAAHEGCSFQEYILAAALGRINIFTGRIAVARAMERYPNGEEFSLRNLYSKEEWKILQNRGASASFGKSFYTYVTNNPTEIMFVGGGHDGKRATYRRKKKGE